MTRIGILALQGAVEPHREKLQALGVEPVLVRTPAQLDGLSGIILPGGESTTLLRLLEFNQLWEPLWRFVREKPSWGLCAGAILLAKEVLSPSQKSLGVLPVTIERNGYGRQVDSFIAALEADGWSGSSVEGVFIRAPRFQKLEPAVSVLFRFESEPVMVEWEQVLAATFHPELTSSVELHRYFVEKCQRG